VVLQGRTLFGYFFYSLEKVSEPKAKIQRFFEKGLTKKKPQSSNQTRLKTTLSQAKNSLFKRLLS